MRSVLTFIFSSVSVFGFTQSDFDSARYYSKKVFSIIAGYNYSGLHAGEIGIGRFAYSSDGRHPFFTTVYFSNEFSSYKDKLLYVPKAGVWASGGCCGGSMGLSLMYFAHPANSSLKLRPEIGFGAFIFRMYYGRTISITQKNFWPISKNTVGVNFIIPTRNLAK